MSTGTQAYQVVNTRGSEIGPHHMACCRATNSTSTSTCTIWSRTTDMSKSLVHADLGPGSWIKITTGNGKALGPLAANTLQPLAHASQRVPAAHTTGRSSATAMFGSSVRNAAGQISRSAARLLRRPFASIGLANHHHVMTGRPSNTPTQPVSDSTCSLSMLHLRPAPPTDRTRRDTARELQNGISAAIDSTGYGVSRAAEFDQRGDKQALLQIKLSKPYEGWWALCPF